MSISSSRFHNLTDDFDHYAFMSNRRIRVTTAGDAATFEMGAMIQVYQGTYSSTKFKYRIATLSGGTDEAIAHIVAGMENNLPKATAIKTWEANFDMRSSWKDKAVIVGAWSETIASAPRRFAGSDKSVTIVDNNESSFRDQLVGVRRGAATDNSAQSGADRGAMSVTDELSTLCLLVAPPIIFEGSHLPPTQQESPNSSSAQKMWKLPSVALSADGRHMALNTLQFTEGFKPENGPPKVDCFLGKRADIADTLDSWREGITSNESPRILSALDSFREALIKVMRPQLVPYGLHHADQSEFGPYVSNLDDRLICLDE